MNKIFKAGGCKPLVIFAFIITDIFVSALNSHVDLNNNAASGIDVVVFFLLLLFIIIAPAFKKREKTTFYNDY